ncbi:MAG: TerB family tellurite resistance protein [Lachnospiraceae bacterium]|nr:TerB family tellurite resistance protein [Lachnospiraceae bacterium]
MFLEILQDDQKDLFLQLAVIAARENGYVDEAESEMLLKFASEMKIPPRAEAIMSLDEIVDELAKSCDKREKKIVLFETAGIMNSDGEYNDEEYEFIKKIADKFEISEEELGAMMGLVSDYVALFNEIIITVIDDENEI